MRTGPSQLVDTASALIERRSRAERLAVLLDELDEADGRLAEDPEEDAHLEVLLGGPA